MEYRDFEWKKPHVIAYKITFKDDIELVVSHTIMKLKRTRRGCEAQLKNIEAYSKETLDELCEKFSKDRDKLESSLKDFKHAVLNSISEGDTKEIISFQHESPFLNILIKVYPNRFFWIHWKRQKHVRKMIKAEKARKAAHHQQNHHSAKEKSTKGSWT